MPPLLYKLQMVSWHSFFSTVSIGRRTESKVVPFKCILEPRNKVANVDHYYMSVLVQVSFECNFESAQKRRSRSYWKPNRQLVRQANSILAAHVCKCLQGTRDWWKTGQQPFLGGSYLNETLKSSFIRIYIAWRMSEFLLVYIWLNI